MNEKREIELRHLQNTLLTLGFGVILFGFWTAVKTLIVYYEGFMEFWTEEMGELIEIMPWLLPFGAFMFFSFISVDLLVRVFVGLSARSEARGRRKKGIVYLAWAFFLAALSALSIRAMIVRFLNHDETVWDTNVTLLIEATSMYILLHLIVTVLRIRHLEKERAKGGKTDAA